MQLAPLPLSSRGRLRVDSEFSSSMSSLQPVGDDDWTGDEGESEVWIPAGEQTTGLFVSIDCGCGLTQVPGPVPLLMLAAVMLLECSSGVGPMTFSGMAAVCCLLRKESLKGISLAGRRLK